MISVIVPVYKVEPYLKQCLDSIVNQTYKDLEILLIDDCSPDNCGTICDEYAMNDKRIRVFHLPENRGLSAARNIGLDNARGEYIGFTDSDDWIEPDMYEVLLKALEENGADLCSCGHYREGRKKEKRTQTTAVYDNTSDSLIALVKGMIGANVWAILYRSFVFASIRFPNGKNYEDMATMHLLFEQCRKVVAISSILYHYRERENSITKTYTANNLIGYADACLERYNFFKNTQREIYLKYKNQIRLNCARGIIRVWLYWHGCSEDNKGKYSNRIKELCQFSKQILSPFMAGHVPLHFRIAIVFMRHCNRVSFITMYKSNHIYRFFHNIIRKVH